MAASSIPNLNTLRTGGGRGRGRERGVLTSDRGSSHQADQTARDKIIQQTDQDASVSRLSAVNLGYMDDPFAELFVSGEPQQRYPIINRGTYVRTRAIDNLVLRFLDPKTPVKKQIISLGAGSDTRFFRLIRKYPDLQGEILYHEIDFPTNTAQKVSTIQRSIDLCRIAGIEPSAANNTSLVDNLHSPHYHVHPLDLRELDSHKPVPKTFEYIQRNLPTLILSECCLIYLDPDHADNAAKFFTRFFFPSNAPVGMLIYEPINPDDAFGKVMVSNLAARGIVLRTLKKYGSLETQQLRMKAYGFESSKAADVNELWATGSDEAEKNRVAGLEFLDEIEEWQLLAGHYCVAWGWRGDEPDLWSGWGEPATRDVSDVSGLPSD